MTSSDFQNYLYQMLRIRRIEEQVIGKQLVNGVHEDQRLECARFMQS